MARTRRIMVRLSLPMEVSLALLAGRRGRPESEVAHDLLRGALQRTSDTADARRIVAERRAYATNAEWRAYAAEAAEELRRCKSEETAASES